MSHLLEMCKNDKRDSWNDIIQNKDTVLKKWNDLGFLQGIEEEYKPCLASWYEYMAFILINDEDGKYTGDDNGTVETVSFPILRRIYSKIIEDYKDRNIDNNNSFTRNRFNRMKYSFLNTGFEFMLDELLRTNKLLFEPCKEVYGEYMDIEAEITAQFCNYYYSKLIMDTTEDDLTKQKVRKTKIKFIKNELDNYFELLP